MGMESVCGQCKVGGSADDEAGGMLGYDGVDNGVEILKQKDLI